LARVVTLSTANDNDYLRHLDQFFQRELSIFCWFANRVRESNLSAWMRARDFRDQRANTIDWLSCLGDDPVTRSRRKIPDVGEFIDDEGIGKISDQTAHFDVIGQADDHRKATGLHQSLELFVRVSNERARAIRHDEGPFV
jgi:hypothetical protein